MCPIILNVVTLCQVPTSDISNYRLFYGKWPDLNGRGQTDLLVEQVSHHPPITAYAIENKSKGVKLVGHNAQKTSFSGMGSMFA
jgi:hypothetical protein